MRSFIRLVLALGVLLSVLHGWLWAQPACDPYRDPTSCVSPTTPPAWNPYGPPPDWPQWLSCEDHRVLAAGLLDVCDYVGPFAPYDAMAVRARAMCEPFTVRPECRVPTGDRPAVLWTQVSYRTAEGVEVRVVGQVYTRTAEIVYVVWWRVPGAVGQYGAWPRSAGPEPLCAGAGAVPGCP